MTGDVTTLIWRHCNVSVVSQMLDENVRDLLNQVNRQLSEHQLKGPPPEANRVELLITNRSVGRIVPQWTRDAIITSLLRQNDIATSFWRYNDVIITSCVRWILIWSGLILTRSIIIYFYIHDVICMYQTLNSQNTPHMWYLKEYFGGKIIMK